MKRRIRMRIQPDRKNDMREGKQLLLGSYGNARLEATSVCST